MAETVNSSSERYAFLDIDGTLSEHAVFFPWVKDQARNKLIDPACLSDMRDLEKEFVLLQSASEGDIQPPISVYDEELDDETNPWSREEVAVTRYEAVVLAILALHAKALEGKNVEKLQIHAGLFFSQPHLWRPWARPSVSRLEKDFGYKNIIATALPDMAAIAIAKYFGVRKQFATLYRTTMANNEQVFTGELGPTLATAGRRCAVAIEQTRFIPRDSPNASILAFDDSIAGAGMLYYANQFDGAFGVAPSPELRHICKQCGWKIIPNEPELDSRQMPLILREHLDSSSHAQALLDKGECIR